MTLLAHPDASIRLDPQRATIRDTRTDIPSSPIIINEVANRDDVNNQYEWIELRNVSTTDEVNLNNYQISILTAVDKDEQFIILPNNGDAKIPAGGVLVLTDSDPFGDLDHPLAIGWDVDKSDEDQIGGLAAIGINATSLHGRYKVVTFGGHNSKHISGLPDDGNFILVVRKPDNHEDNHGHGGKGRAELGKNDLDKITDIAGYTGALTKTSYTNAVSKTDLWPLKQQGAPASNKNRFLVNTVQRRQKVGTNNGQSGTGTTHNDKKDGQVAFVDHGYTGIGYRRQVANSSVYGGDPGYHGVLKNNATELTDGNLVISEIMLSQGVEGTRTKLPQWIEIHNPSSKAVNLHAGDGWRLIIENPRDPIRTINFKNSTVRTILPEQTVIIVSGSARDFGSDTLHASTVFPTTRVFNVYRDIKDEFDMETRFDPILDSKTFRITLIDGAALDLTKVTPDEKHLKVGSKYYTISDDIGNLDGNARTNDVAAWEYPDGITKDGYRSSLVRVFDDGVARNGVSMDKSNVLPMHAATVDATVDLQGNFIPADYSWIRAWQAGFGNVRHTWYGSENDFGSPLNRRKQILPVQLSFFRPTLQDGKVTILWTTESELDNAGFNILRSESRNGEFKQVNSKLVQGAGTTGERNTYKWVDESAKPGVVYYYQIEDVSFAGEHQTLTTTKLKGLISAKNKLTTLWGGLKEVQ